MKSYNLALVFGFLIWAPMFAVTIAFSTIAPSAAQFKSVLPVLLAAMSVLFSTLYFKRVENDFFREGAELGAIWLIIALGMDRMIFGAESSPMQIGLVEYAVTTGITYLISPIVTVGFGYLMERQRTNMSARPN